MNLEPSPERRLDREALAKRFYNLVDWLAVSYNPQREQLQYGRYFVQQEGPVAFNELRVDTSMDEGNDSLYPAHTISLMDADDVAFEMTLEKTAADDNTFSMAHGYENHVIAPDRSELTKVDSYLGWIEQQLTTGQLQPDAATARSLERLDEQKMAIYLLRVGTTIMGDETEKFTRQIRSDFFHNVEIANKDGILQIMLSTNWKRRFPNDAYTFERTLQMLAVNREQRQIVFHAHEHQVGTGKLEDLKIALNEELVGAPQESRELIIKRMYHAFAQLSREY